MLGDLVKAALAGSGEAFALAAVCATVLWVILRIRRSTETWRYTKRLPTTIGFRSRRRETVLRDATSSNHGLVRTSFALGAVTLVLVAAYISLKMIPEAFEYAELKRNISRSQQIFRFATWSDPELRCPSSDPLGVQMLRLFDKYEAYLIRTRWDVIPPRYEFLVVGITRLAHGTVQRRLDLDVHVSIGGDATLDNATLLGEEKALNVARKLLINACLRERSEARVGQ